MRLTEDMTKPLEAPGFVEGDFTNAKQVNTQTGFYLKWTYVYKIICKRQTKKWVVTTEVFDEKGACPCRLNTRFLYDD